MNKSILLFGALLITIAFAMGCSKERPEGGVAITGEVSTNHDTLALIQISENDFTRCLEAFDRAKNSDNHTAVGFMKTYKQLTPLASYPVQLKSRKFKDFVPKGNYLMVILDGGHGFFLPLSIRQDSLVTFDAEAVIMTNE